MGSFTGNPSDLYASAMISGSCTPCPAEHGYTLLVEFHDATLEDPVIDAPLSNPEDCAALFLSTRRYVLQDEQMSVYALVDNDGVVKEGYEYDPYGAALVFKPSVPSGSVTFTASDSIQGPDYASSAYTYTGRRYDSESHLMFYRSRYMDTELGRFISRDTIGVWGDAANLGSGSAYVGDSAHGQIDPMGTFPLACAFGALACLSWGVGQAIKEGGGNWGSNCGDRYQENKDFSDAADSVERACFGHDRCLATNLVTQYGTLRLPSDAINVKSFYTALCNEAIVENAENGSCQTESKSSDEYCELFFRHGIISIFWDAATTQYRDATARTESDDLKKSCMDIRHFGYSLEQDDNGWPAKGSAVVAGAGGGRAAYTNLLAQYGGYCQGW